MKHPRKSTSVVLSLFVFAALTLGGCSKEAATTSTAKSAVSVDNAALVFSDNYVTQFDQTEWVSCANGGNGENIHYSGPLHVLVSGTFTNNTGKVHYSFQPQGIQGVGDVTGDKYIITSGYEETIAGSFINGRFVDTWIPHFGIQSSSTHLSGQGTFHFTYNANGEETAFFDNFHSSCN